MKKAEKMDRTYKHSCDICMLLDSEEKDMKFYKFKEAEFGDPDRYICQNCLDDVKSLKKEAKLKADNPQHERFKGFIPWFTKEMPEVRKGFLSNKTEKKVEK